MNDPKVAVLGCGTMGQGIARVCAANGLRTVLFKLTNEQNVDEVRTTFQDGLQKEALSPKAKLSKEEHLDILGNLSWSTWTDRVYNIKDCDVVIESTEEKLSTKQDLFKQLDFLVKPSAILASNTSTLSITELASVTKRADRVIGFHAFNPFKVMKLVEVAKTKSTSAKTVEAGRTFAQRLGKMPIVVGDTPGFIVNRLLTPYLLDAIRGYKTGPASMEDIDSAVKTDYKFPMGPIELADYIGLDILLAMAKSLHSSLHEERFTPPAELQSLVDKNMLGKKTKIGFYDYKAVKRTPALTDITTNFVADHLLTPYLLDAIRCFRNGLASIEDIDLAMELGCGLPKGPFALCDEIGLEVILAKAKHWYGLSQDERFVSPLLLNRLVDSKMFGEKSEKKIGFYDYTNGSKQTNSAITELINFDRSYAW
jgi:3-hydroxyacyl-CoA dehydrogenase